MAGLWGCDGYRNRSAQVHGTCLPFPLHDGWTANQVFRLALESALLYPGAACQEA
jgi:hypothetical protein